MRNGFFLKKNGYIHLTEFVSTSSILIQYCAPNIRKNIPAILSFSTIDENVICQLLMSLKTRSSLNDNLNIKVVKLCIPFYYW